MTDTNENLITIYTKKGAEQVPALARWTEKVGEGEYEFALHVIPQEGVYNPLLGLTEVSTGASMQAEMLHPNGSGKLLESHTKPGHRGYLPADKLARLAYGALKKQIRKIPAERFEQMVGLNLLARAQRDQVLAAREKAQPAIDEQRGEEEAAFDQEEEAAFDQEQASVEEKPLDNVEPEVELPPAKSEASE